MDRQRLQASLDDVIEAIGGGFSWGAALIRW